MTELVEAISQVGFPIVCTLILAYVVFDMNDKNDERMSEFIKTIAANTQAISELSIYIKENLKAKDKDNE